MTVREAARPTSWLGRLGGFLVGLGEPAFWTVSVSDRVVGSLVYQAGAWRLSWFADADPRLLGYDGPVTGDLAALATRLGVRSGLEVSIDPVIG